MPSVQNRTSPGETHSMGNTEGRGRVHYPKPGQPHRMPMPIPCLCPSPCPIPLCHAMPSSTAVRPRKGTGMYPMGHTRVIARSSADPAGYFGAPPMLSVEALYIVCKPLSHAELPCKAETPHAQDAHTRDRRVTGFVLSSPPTPRCRTPNRAAHVHSPV